MFKHEIYTFRMAEQGDEFDDLNIQPYLIQELGDCPIVITLCEGNIEVLAEELRDKIFEENHCSPSADHKGVKTHWCIRERFYWPGMKDRIH